MDENPESIDEIEKRMKRAGAFHPDDLMFNQAGELSPHQRRWLQLEIVGWGFQIVIYSVVIISASVFYYLQFQQDANRLWLVGGLFWSTGLGYGIWMSAKNIQPIWADITNYEVKSVAGVIVKDGSSTQYYQRRAAANWSVQIRGEQFSIFPFVFDSLIAHKSYRIFYTPSLRRVINIEPLFHLDDEKQSTLAALQARTKENEEKPT